MKTYNFRRVDESDWKDVWRGWQFTLSLQQTRHESLICKVRKKMVDDDTDSV